MTLISVWVYLKVFFLELTILTVKTMHDIGERILDEMNVPPASRVYVHGGCSPLSY
jgi:hypothetical protein